MLAMFSVLGWTVLCEHVLVLVLIPRRVVCHRFFLLFTAATQVRRLHAGLQPRVRKPQHHLQGE